MRGCYNLFITFTKFNLALFTVIYFCMIIYIFNTHNNITNNCGHYLPDCGSQLFILSRKGGILLVINDYIYRSNLKRHGRETNKIYWECIHNRSKKCRSRLKTVGDDLFITNETIPWNNKGNFNISVRKFEECHSQAEHNTEKDQSSQQCNIWREEENLPPGASPRNESAVFQLKEEVKKELSDLKNIIIHQNEEIMKIQIENLVLLRQLSRQEYSAINIPYFFPIETEEALNVLENDIRDKEDEIVATMKQILSNGGIQKHIYKLFGHEIIMNFNYDGVKGKKSFKELKNINTALFKALLQSGYTKDDYIKDVKMAFKLYKNRYHKNQCIRKKNCIRKK